MNHSGFYSKFQVDMSPVIETGFNPYYNILDSGLDSQLLINGEKYIDLASNNYLGLATDNRVKKAYKNAVEKYGASYCSTPIASGYSRILHDLEKELSNFVGLESSIIYPSCYQANNGLFNSITGADDIVFIDRCSHSSLFEGLKASGCKIRPYPHNDLEYLEKIMKNTQKYRNAFVVTESVFSTEGTIAPFDSIVKLCDRYDVIPVIDDSHGIGVLGENGSGILEHFGITDYNGVYTASLGKALANSGGLVSGKKTLIDYLKYYSSHLVYSTALPPVILAGIGEVLKIIKKDYTNLRQKLWENRNALYLGLQEMGYELTDGEAPIISIRSGSMQNTLLLAKKLFKKRILSTPFVYPSVKKNEGRIRLIAGANIEAALMEKLFESFKNLN